MFRYSQIVAMIMLSGNIYGGQLKYITTPFQASLMSRDGHVFVGTNTGGVFRSVDMGSPVSLDPPFGYYSFIPTGISDDGSVIIGWTYSDNGYRSVRWTQIGGSKILIPTGQYLNSRATCVSGDGKTISGISLANLPPYIWKKETLAQPLPLSLSDTPFAISENGEVVVGQAWKIDHYAPFYCTKNTDIKFFGSLNSSNPYSWATVVSANGLILGGVDLSISYNRPVQWVNGIITSLTSTNDPNLVSAPVSITSDGSIIVGERFRWSEDSGIQNLSDVLLCHYIHGLTSKIVAISGDGRKVLTGSELIIFPSCPADLNNDGVVDDSDFSIFVVAYDDFLDATGDLNYDCYTDDKDFSIFVVAYDQLICD